MFVCDHNMNTAYSFPPNPCITDWRLKQSFSKIFSLKLTKISSVEQKSFVFLSVSFVSLRNACYAKRTTRRGLDSTGILRGTEEGDLSLRDTKLCNILIKDRHLWTVQWDMQKADDWLIRERSSVQDELIQRVWNTVKHCSPLLY